MIAPQQLTGLILAGGEGRRMGGRDKGLAPFEGLPLFAHALKRLEGRVSETLVSANRNQDAYALLGPRVIEDARPGFFGPLMGIYSGLLAAKTPWLIVVPCDTPLLPMTLVERLVGGLDGGQAAIAFDGERDHPTVALIATALADDLGAFLASGERKLGRWFERFEARRVDFSDVKEAFVNLNSEEALKRLELGRADARRERP
ncbi:molybdenum cofactor guanylyltransferase MobA [Halomonas sp. GD1P12]|uniref:molybdenum cofactor guanylyltransferase MobA n=1 Tax=Halomonas sp. GD1P12 TaxID=2982691 RepID=UPI0021E47D5A|nr:molybdenum cofactor guanylyltransferase MobA [Halomonas sp. GD1P12]UYG00352.1 molybdenum cofactor guanylyltransferase [Halomonas sp. GD1P12]